MKRPFVQGVLLIVIAAVLALVSNAVAGRERRLMLPGWYPNALKVPPRAAVTPVPSPVPTMTTSSEPMPMPVPATTATVAPATATTTTAPTPTPAAVPAALDARDARRSTPPPAVDLSRFQPHPDKPYVEISGEDAAALHKAGVLFLDARRTSVYEEGHIAGARSYSVWESDIDEKVNKLFEERSDPTAQNKPIVIYCSGGACEDSHMLAQKLWGIQFNNVYVYKDGYPDWVQRRGPIEK